jgi:hypothetical protein
MKTQKVMACATVAVALAMTLVTPTARAQDPDPPGRVARLNYSVGSVSFQPGGEGDWVTAVPNRPLTTGDNLWCDRDSRAELHVGSTAIRMDAETSLTFLDLDDRTMQLRLSAGSLILRVRHLDDDDIFEVDTPNLAFSVLRPGLYRVEVNADGNETATTVWQGRGEVTGGGDSYTVIGGQQARFSGTEQLDHEIAQIPPRDDFVEWAFQRDQREDRSESANYISSEMTGYEDLDDYGHWHYAAGYGPVWMPAGVPAGWAPYRYGHWVWVAPWGWTWVEDEPWGFAPFHYGRWADVDGGWCWVPGPVVVRPVYAPAMVAFVGGGGGFRFSVAVGGGPGVAWFPLAPGEVWVPPYRVSRGYVNNVNITNTRVNVTQVTNVYNVYNSNTTNNTHITYVNQHVTNAVTVVSHDTFVNARPVARNVVQVNEREIVEAPVSHMAPVQPERASVLGAGAPARSRPPVAVVNRQVVATRTPSLPRAPFDQRQATVNVRTEAPGQPRPVVRGTSDMPQGGTGPGQPNAVPHPAQPSQPQETYHPAPAVPQGGMRPGQPNAVPHPAQPSQPQETYRPAPAVPQGGMRPGQPNAVPHPAQPSQPQESYHPEASAPPERNVPRPPPTATEHPLVRTAPPIEQRPQQQQNEEQKFRNWDQQRQQQQARTEPRPPERNSPPQSQEKPQKQQEKDKR